jgi:hypothetical protein
MHDYEIYCDESRPELFVAGPTATITAHAAIGSVWLATDSRKILKERVSELRSTHGIWGEAKWTKVGMKSLAFYCDLVDLLLLDPGVRFRAIVIEAHKLDLARFHQADAELGFYKFYYQALHHWTLEGKTARVFCDAKVNRDLSRLQTLKRVLNRKFDTPCIDSIYSVESRESSIVQLCDVLLGAVQAKFNESIVSSQAKAELLGHIEDRIGHPLGATFQSERQFNIFKIKLSNGPLPQ